VARTARASAHRPRERATECAEGRTASANDSPHCGMGLLNIHHTFKLFVASVDLWKPTHEL
jgi:hypothetical protein